MAQTLPRVPPARSPTLTVAVEEPVSVGAVTPAWPTPPSGAVVTYEVVYEPDGSSASVDAAGEVTTDTEGVTIVQMDSTLLGNVVQRAVGVVYTPPTGGEEAEAGLGWETLGDYDFTGLDSATLAVGTGNVQKSGVNYGPGYKVHDYSSNLGTVTAGATGVTIDGNNSNSGLSCSFDLDDIVASLPQDNVLWVDFVLVGVAEVDSGSDGLRIGLCDSGGNFSAGTRNLARFNYVSAGIGTWQTETDSTATTWLASQTIHTSYVVSLLIIGGYIVSMFLQQNTETPPTSSTISAGGRMSARNVAAGSSATYDTTSRLGFQAIWGAKATLKRLRVQRRAGVIL
jgi:hypothetical protein